MDLMSIVIPCFNEEEAIPFFYDKLTEVLTMMNCNYELVWIDDGSRDDTLSVVKKLAEKDEHILYLSLSRNFGKEAAMYAGFCNARGDYVAVMDADMQDPPELLPKMLRILKEEPYDSVATRRTDRKGEPFVRSWFARRFYQIINQISDVDIIDGARDFRLMKRKMVDAIISMNEYNRFQKEFLDGWVLKHIGLHTKI